MFLNVPYDDQYEPLFLAAIAGLCGLGLRPRAALELPSSRRRLDRIFRLIRTCRYSIHDLSRVEATAGGVPRFNMPFEAGLAVAIAHVRRHDWWLLETRPHRLQQSLSDLNGSDPVIHGGRSDGMLQALDSIFSRPAWPEIPLGAIRDLLVERAPEVRRRYGGLYTPGGFRTLVYGATTLSARLSAAAVRARRR